MVMRVFKSVLILGTALCLSACSTPAKTGTADKAHTEILVQSTESWDGESFSYPDGDPQLTVARITIPAGVALPMHCHPVPLGGVLSKGTLEVTKQNGQKLLLNENEGLIEVSNQWHFGRALEEVEIIVVYAGASEVPVTVLKDSDSEWVTSCR